MTTQLYSGSCLCGMVRFEISGPIKDIICCHCSECRKAQGSAFATNGNVDADNFRFITGENELTGYASSSDQIKYFCKHCGSPVISKRTSKPGTVRIRLGTVDSDITESPGAHIFVGSKANWEDLDDELPRYDEFEPGRDK